MTRFDKALSALLTSAIVFASAIGFDVPEWATAEWIGAISAALNPLGVYFLANKA